MYTTFAGLGWSGNKQTKTEMKKASNAIIVNIGARECAYLSGSSKWGLNVNN